MLNILHWSGQHLEDLKDPFMEDVLLETENMLAHGRMDLPLSLCFATIRGDDQLLNQLLKRGLDPNESDNSGRTALVNRKFRDFAHNCAYKMLSMHFIFLCHGFSILQHLMEVRIAYSYCWILVQILTGEV